MAFDTVVVRTSSLDEGNPIRTDDTRPQLLPQGQVGYAGKPELGANLLHLYIAPDIAGWDWLIPIVLSTSAPSFSDELSEVEAHADLLGLGNGTLNLAAFYHHEWRGNTDDGKPTQSGLFVDVGGMGKFNVASTNTTGRDTYVLTSPFAQAELRLTTRSTKDAKDYSGLLHARLTLGGSFFLSHSAALAEILTTPSVSNFTFAAFSMGYFPFDGASINLFSYSRAWGDEIGRLKDSWAFGLTLYPGSL